MLSWGKPPAGGERGADCCAELCMVAGLGVCTKDWAAAAVRVRIGSVTAVGVCAELCMLSELSVCTIGGAAAACGTPGPELGVGLCAELCMDSVFAGCTTAVAGEGGGAPGAVVACSSMASAARRRTAGGVFGLESRSAMTAMAKVACSSASSRK